MRVHIPRNKGNIHATTRMPSLAHYITLPELAKSLPAKPITVVFDVDDTVLFTSPGFSAGNPDLWSRDRVGGDGAFGEEILANSENE